MSNNLPRAAYGFIWVISHLAERCLGETSMSSTIVISRFIGCRVDGIVDFVARLATVLGYQNRRRKCVAIPSVWVGVLLCLMSGCASKMQIFSEASGNIHQPSAGNGRIYIYRANEFTGSGIEQRIFVNGEQVGPHLGNGSVFFVDKPAGNYNVEAKEGLINPNLFGSTRQVNFVLNSGDTKYVRIAMHKIGRAHV